MAEIIKHGMFHYQEPDRWIGETVTCCRCGCVFNIESASEVKKSYLLEGLYHGWYANVDCPECKMVTQVRMSGG